MKEQVAVVAGIAEYPFNALKNAARDAREVRDVLSIDYGFQSWPRGGLIDAEATLAALKAAVAESLERADEETRWLFYFAGHGDLERGGVFLNPYDGGREGLEAWLPLDWLVARTLDSRAGEALIVVDACYAGRVLMRSDLEPWIERDTAEVPGTVQILASGLAPVSDGGGGTHSVFTASLVEALGGWPAIHDDKGAVRFTELLNHLDREVDLRLKELGWPNRQQLVGATLDSGPRGDFRFEPCRPPIPPDVVRGIRQDTPLPRRRALAQLESFCRAEKMAESWTSDLSLARCLVLEGRPRNPAAEPQFSPLNDPDPRVRRRAVRLLGRLEEVAARSREFGQGIERLRGTALDDAKPAVRHEARKSLARVSSRVELGDPETDETSWSRRWRRWSLRTTVPSWRRKLRPLQRSFAHATRGMLAVAHAARLFLESPWRRGLTAGAAAGLVLVYFWLGAHYYLSSTERTWVVLRVGLPGFEALPGIGEVAVSTGYTLRDLDDPLDAAEERLDGWWLATRGGVRAWGPRLASRLGPANAALAHWRLGDLETALDRLARDLQAGEKASVKPAAYVALHSDDAFDPVVELLVEALASRNRDLRDEAARALGVLRTARREEAAAAADGLRGTPEGSPEREAAAILAGNDEADGDGEIADPRTVPALLAAVADADPEVRGAALDSLVRRALDGGVDLTLVEPALAEALDERSPWIRRQAIDGTLLLADSSDRLFEAAFQRVIRVLDSEAGLGRKDELAELFRGSTERAAARFGRRLLLYLAEEEPAYDRDFLFATILPLVATHPRILREWISELTRLLASSGDTSDLAGATVWHLNQIRYELRPDFGPLIEAFLVRIRSPSLDDRRAAALVLGLLVTESPEPAARALDELERVLEETDAELRSRIAESLKWIAARHGELAPRAVGLLLGGLGESEPAMRASFADALAWSAEAETARLPVTPPGALRGAMADEDPGVRRDAARALALFGKRQRRELAETVAWVRERLTHERESRVRLELVAALAALAGENPEVVDEVAGILRSELLGLDSVVPTQRGELVRAVGAVGFHSETGARAALEALGGYLLGVDDPNLQFDAAVNGIGPIARFHPALRNEALRVLEAFLKYDWQRALRRPAQAHAAGRDEERRWLRVRGMIRSTWVELMAESAAEDPDVLWRFLGSRWSGDRNTALDILGHLCRKRPDLIPEIRAGLQDRRRDVQPYVRDGVARAIELIGLLEMTAGFRGDEASRERWKDVLRWIQDGHLVRTLEVAWELLHGTEG